MGSSEMRQIPIIYRFRRIGDRRAWVAHIALAFALLAGLFCQIAQPGGGGVAAAPPPPGSVAPGAPAPRYTRRLGTAAAPIPRAGQPVRLKIPSIGVDAAVEQVGKTPDGAMDVPSNFFDTAWYQLGPRPGETGNAVIDGHVDSTTGKAIFWDLRKLAHGDQITVVGDDGVERHFVVSDTGTYATQDVPLARVFGSATGAHLNLITCDSNTTFNQTTHSYDGNLVVYADAVP
jgi:hypothetical protein